MEQVWPEVVAYLRSKTKQSPDVEIWLNELNRWIIMECMKDPDFEMTFPSGLVDGLIKKHIETLIEETGMRIAQRLDDPPPMSSPTPLPLLVDPPCPVKPGFPRILEQRRDRKPRPSHFKKHKLVIDHSELDSVPELLAEFVQECFPLAPCDQSGNWVVTSLQIDLWYGRAEELFERPPAFNIRLTYGAVYYYEEK
jgi:hypothetical protein